MFYAEHNPPHFHSVYGEFKATIKIDDLGIYEGYLPPKALGLVVEWANIHKKNYWIIGIVPETIRKFRK